MKQHIFKIVSLIFFLLLIYQYTNYKANTKSISNTLEEHNQAIIAYKDSLSILQERFFNASHFSLENNEDAINYFENSDYDINVNHLETLIKNELYKLNEKPGEHPLVPYAPSEGGKILINTMQILNHKWIIADFSDGSYWGELFIKYEVKHNSEVHFSLIDHFMYLPY